MLQITYVNARNQWPPAVEHQIPVLMEFVSVEQAMHVVVMEKSVVRDLACAELFQLVLE